MEKNLAIFTDSKNDTDILVTLVEKKNYVYIRDRPAIDHLIYNDYRFRKSISLDDEKIQCPFAVSKTPFLTRRRAFAYPINSTWSVLFDQELLHLVESGIIKYIVSEGLPKAEICPQNLGGTERQLRNSDLLMTYMVMIAGFCTGFAVFVSELIFRHLNNRNATKQNSFVENLNQSKNAFLPNFSPPPPYASLFSKNKNPFLSRDFSEKDIPRKTINGRNYMVVKGNNNETRLIPMRTPSAAIFQYSYSN